MQQTAVEWLESKMPTAFKDLTINKQLIQQAKEMEKQQIIDAFDEGNPNGFIIKSGEQYYNETFKQ
jgi:hypothetical protein